MVVVPIQVEAKRGRTVAVDVERNKAVAVEIHDFQRLGEVFHLHRVRAESAHLPKLFFVAHQGRKLKVIGLFLVEFLALLCIVAVDFAEAEEQGASVLQLERASKTAAITITNILRISFSF